jgi:hypothetical protein
MSNVVGKKFKNDIFDETELVIFFLPFQRRGPVDTGQVQLVITARRFLAVERHIDRWKPLCEI